MVYDYGKAFDSFYLIPSRTVRVLASFKQLGEDYNSSSYAGVGYYDSAGVKGDLRLVLRLFAENLIHHCGGICTAGIVYYTTYKLQW